MASGMHWIYFWSNLRCSRSYLLHLGLLCVCYFLRLFFIIIIIFYLFCTEWKRTASRWEMKSAECVWCVQFNIFTCMHIEWVNQMVVFFLVLYFHLGDGAASHCHCNDTFSFNFHIFLFFLLIFLCSVPYCHSLDRCILRFSSFFIMYSCHSKWNESFTRVTGPEKGKKRKIVKNKKSTKRPKNEHFLPFFFHLKRK